MTNNSISLKREDINIRDPYVLVHNDLYYMYGTRGATCWGLADGIDVYTSNDLVSWEGPIEVFKNDGSFWANQNYWAPEVHCYNDSFYLFATFKNDEVKRGTQILRSDLPVGPFVPISEGPVTPREWECLDGTFYLDKQKNPYIVFCHEWIQIKDGTICSIPLTKDLKAAAGEPKVLFHASSASWVVDMEHGDKGLFVTDGPFMYRGQTGKLYMLWSSTSEGGYSVGVAYSDNQDIDGNWLNEEQPLFQEDGGHGMLFKSLEGKLLLALHSPNETLKERPFFYEIIEENDQLFVKNN
jgi:GH43 family beta-xylosidase